VSDNIQKMAELFEAVAEYQQRIAALQKDGLKIQRDFEKEMMKLEKRGGENVRSVAYNRYVPTIYVSVDDAKHTLADAKRFSAFGRLLDKAREKDERVAEKAKKLAERLKKQAKKADKAVKAKTAVKVVAEASAPVVWQQPKVDEAALGT